MRPLLLAVLAVAVPAFGQAPAFTRDGADFFSAPLELVEKKAVPHACGKQFGKNAEVQEEPAEGSPAEAVKRYLCSVPTASEPRLSIRLREELALLDELPEPKRSKMVATVTEKYALLAQCPEGTKARHDGTIYFCVKAFAAKELCPAGAPTVLESGEVGCVLSTCPKSFTDLSALTRGEHPGCFKCPKGAYDAKETAAFYGALKGLPATYTEVFCRAPVGK